MTLHKLHYSRHVLLPNGKESCRLKKRLLINRDKATCTTNNSNFKQVPSYDLNLIKVALLITALTFPCTAMGRGIRSMGVKISIKYFLHLNIRLGSEGFFTRSGSR